MKISPITTTAFKGQPKNYSRIDSLLSRSAQPQKEDFEWLKEQGITDIINFRTMFVSAIDFNEQKVVEDLGMEYHNIPSKTRQPEISNIRIFLDMVEGIRKRGGKAHIHCKAGADRTGMYAFIYKFIHGLGNIADNEKEWIAKGHNTKIYPNLIKQTEEIISKLHK